MAEISFSAPPEGPSKPKRSKRVYVRKSDEVLSAAERVFLREGFAATSMDQVADEACVSKRTVYSNFESKERLFAEVIARRCAAVIPNEQTMKAALKQPFEAGLQTLAESFLRGLFHPAQIELYQTVIAAVRRRPEVGQIMYDGPIAKTQDLFADFLREPIVTGKLTLTDPDVAAAQLIALLKTNIHMKLLFGRPVRVSRASIAASARDSVRLFLNGALPRGAG